MDWKIQLFRLNYNHLENDAVTSVMHSRWLTMGEKTVCFENEFSEYLGYNSSCIAVSSCTAALHMSLLSLGVGPGDEVVIPGLTFIADANSVLLTGATPVTADCVSFDDWNISVATISKVITERTKAIIVVHFAGFPCNMASIRKFCSDQNIFLIEDVAHAPGASMDRRLCGTWGDIGCFSFFSNKNISIGEGGMLSSSSPIFSIGLGIYDHTECLV